jgi:hypothetical protein
LNVAVTVLSASIVTWHAAAPEQSPDQPVNVEPEAGLAVSVTWVPGWNCAEQVEPQFTPDGLDVTVPLPVPAFVTVKAKVGGGVIVEDGAK